MDANSSLIMLMGIRVRDWERGTVGMVCLCFMMSSCEKLTQLGAGIIQNRDWQTMVYRPNLARCLFWGNKLYWHKPHPYFLWLLSCFKGRIE